MQRSTLPIKMLHFVDFYPLWLRMQARWQCIKADARSAAFLHLAKKAPDNGATSVPPGFSPSDQLAEQKGEMPMEGQSSQQIPTGTTLAPVV
jgi:hypothetical protein